MPHFDARSFLRHGLTTAVFCCAIALALTVSGQGAWDVQLAYSLGIGLVSWLVIDLGRVLLAPGTGWPHGWRGGVLIATGIATGYVLGSVIGNAYSGSTQHLPHQHGAMSALVITIAAGAGMDKARELAAKAGIEGFVPAFRKELAEEDIKVGLIEPGFTGADFQYPEFPPEKQKELIGKHQMLRAEDIAVAVHFMLVQPRRAAVSLIRVETRLEHP